MTNTVYRFDFVTDPDDPSVTDSLNRLLELLDDNVNQNYLDRGLVRYTGNYLNNDIHESIQEIISNISYIPITVSMDTSSLSGYDNPGVVISSVSDIIKVFTSMIIKTEVINVEKVRYGDVITFLPMTTVDDEKIAVYENPNYLGEYYRIIDINNLVGYQILSHDPIVKYLTRDSKNIKYLNNVGLIPVGTNVNEVDYFNGVVNEISIIIENKRKQGYFPYPISIYNLEDKQLIRELGVLWDIDIVYDDDDIMILQTTTNFGLDPEIWLRENINLVKNGQFPTITLYGPWQFQLGGDFNERYGKNWCGSVLHYGALLAYKKLSENDELIRPFTQATRVNNDYSVSVSLPTYTHLINFKKYFTEITDGYGVEYGDQSWYSEPCDDLIDGVIKRYYVEKLDKNAMPMILPWTYENGNVEQVLVFRSPLLAKYPSPFDFSKVDMNKVRNDLVSDLRKYYQKCHDQVEPVTLDNINEMELVDLLNLVEIMEEGKTYCLSKDTILNLTHHINPLTRKPFSDDVIIKAMLLEWGWRGLFDVGPITGLYTDMPTKVSIKPKGGMVIITKLIMDPMLQSMLGDVYSVEIGFDDGTVSFLFDIATSDINGLKTMIDKLWREGFFLNYWSSSVVKYSDLLTYSTIVTNQLLLNASENKSSGVRAMNYLRMV